MGRSRSIRAETRLNPWFEQGSGSNMKARGIEPRRERHFRVPSAHSSPVEGEEVGSDRIGGSGIMRRFAAPVLMALVFAAPARSQSLEQIVTEAKKEGEVTLVASASTFGGKKGFAELENLFAKRYGFKAKVSLTGGPSFPQVAARIIAEQKAGAKSSTDLYLGSDGTYVTMDQEKALEKVNWSGVFPWITKPMESFRSNQC